MMIARRKILSFFVAHFPNELRDGIGFFLRVVVYLLSYSSPQTTLSLEQYFSSNPGFNILPSTYTDNSNNKLHVESRACVFTHILNTIYTFS